MNRNTLVFIVLICVLFIGHLLINEGFVDSSAITDDQKTQEHIAIMYQGYISMISNFRYNPDFTYDINDQATSQAIYNGIQWRSTVSGKGSQLGIPSDANTNWRKIPFPTDDEINKHGMMNLINAIKKIQGSDFTPLYNELITGLIYDPSRMYRGSDLCIYNGNMWRVVSLQEVTASGSTLGVPSITNSNWMIYQGLNMDPILLQLIKNTAHATPPATPTNPTGPYGAPIDAQFMDSLRADIKNDISTAIKDSLSSSNVMTDSCIDSVSSNQGADFMRYIPGKNPADYIRKDSIPCYGCSIP
jgi:hypothetical protein